LRSGQSSLLDDPLCGSLRFSLHSSVSHEQIDQIVALMKQRQAKL
jgi:hypothetical protein